MATAYARPTGIRPHAINAVMCVRRGVRVGVELVCQSSAPPQTPALSCQNQPPTPSHSQMSQPSQQHTTENRTETPNDGVDRWRGQPQSNVDDHCAISGSHTPTREVRRENTKVERTTKWVGLCVHSQKLGAIGGGAFAFRLTLNLDMLFIEERSQSALHPSARLGPVREHTAVVDLEQHEEEKLC